MQNRNPSQNYPSHSSIVDQAYLDQAYERARARLLGEQLPTEPSLTPTESSSPRTEPSSPPTGEVTGDVAGPHERTAEQLLEGADLLRVLREPVEWLLALAHRLAGGDPVDIAAIARLRAAFHARLAGRSIGIRKTDLLVVFGLLFGALDPSVVFRAVSGTIGDGLAAVLGSESPLALHITGTVDPLTALMDLLAAPPPRRTSGPCCACPVRSSPVR